MDLEQFRQRFTENFSEFGELGASVSVWQHGVEILSLAGGFRDQENTVGWTSETPVLFWSATKGLAAATVLHVLQNEGLAIGHRVSHLWPEFAAAGKRDVTIGQLLSHQAGLCALSGAVPVNDHEAVSSALAAQEPHWKPGTAHGYHPRTFGFLADEVVRRVTGLTLGSYFRQTFAEPLGLALWIGIDPDLADHVAPVFAAKTGLPKGDPFYTAFLTSDSLTARSFASPRGLHSASALNTTEARTASYPGFGGIGTARALAQFYAMLADGGRLGSRTFFSSATLALMESTLATGADRVLLMDTAFSAGFMRDPLGPDGRKLRCTFGPSLRAFGHPGAGGSLGFADPERGLAFAYVMNQMQPGVLPNPRSLRLIDSLYAACG